MTVATEIKERPILFSGEMVRAILEGRKTQTRRVCKGAALEMLNDGFTPEYVASPGNAAWNPYGQPGDRLWVRETFVLQNDVEAEAPPFNDGRPLRMEEQTEYSDYTWQQPHYRATDPEPELDMGDGTEPCCKWSPSIFMPRWASRISLEITQVRIERVQQITNEDAQAEGCDFRISKTPNHANAFAILWDSINAKRGFGWEANPWVWVIEFARPTASNRSSG